MSFIYRIVEYLNDLSDFFYDLMLEVWDWPWPLWHIGYIFYDICLLFNKLAWRFSDFAELLEDWKDKIDEILSWETIKKLLKEWLDYAEDAWDWIKDAWTKVTDIVDEWWDATLVFVKGLIKIAVQGLDDLIEAWDTFWKTTWPELTGLFNNLKAAWDNFWTVTFPTLVNFTWLEVWWNSRLLDVQSLIDTALKNWFPFYDDLVSLWEEIKLFFTDPLQWAYDKLDEFFERFW